MAVAKERQDQCISHRKNACNTERQTEADVQQRIRDLAQCPLEDAEERRQKC